MKYYRRNEAQYLSSDTERANRYIIMKGHIKRTNVYCSKFFWVFVYNHKVYLE